MCQNQLKKLNFIIPLFDTKLFWLNLIKFFWKKNQGWKVFDEFAVIRRSENSSKSPTFISAFICVYLCIRPSVCLSVHFYVHPSFSLPVHVCVCTSVRLSIHLLVCPDVFLCIHFVYFSKKCFWVACLNMSCWVACLKIPSGSDLLPFKKAVINLLNLSCRA